MTVTYRVHPGQRPYPGVREIRERLAQKAIGTLPDPAARRARRLRRTVRVLDRAEDEIVAGRALRGASTALLAVLCNPAPFASPLVGPWTFRRFAGRLARRAGRLTRL